MLIDLHCHTRKIKTGEEDGREVSDELFIEKIKSSGVEIVAITNHNVFDEVQFLRLQRKIGSDCKLWPGIELDIGYGDNGKRYHLLVVCNPKNVIKFSVAVADITNSSNPESYVGNIQEIIEKFDPLDCIFLPHFHKDPGITEEEFTKLESMLSNKNRLVAEATNVRSMGIFASHGISCIVGSDIADWRQYPNMELPELRLRIEKYEHLCKLLDRDSLVVKTLLDKNTPSTYEVRPCAENRSITERHRFFGEINVIFGDKGTGKTEVIKSLVAKLNAEDIPFSKYISSETKDDLKELLDMSDMEKSAEYLGIDCCEDSFQLLTDWGDRTPTLISSYIEYHRTYSAKTNELRVGWSRASNMCCDVDTKLEKIDGDLESITNGIDWIDGIELTDYISRRETSDFKRLLEKLNITIRNLRDTTWIESKAFELANFTFDRFRVYTSAKTGSATRPANTGFEKYAKNRLKLDDSVQKIKTNLTFKERKEYVLLGSTGEKGKIEIEQRHRMLNDLPDTKSSHDEFEGNITKLREIKNGITKVASLTMSVKIDDELVKLKDELMQNRITSICNFIGISKQTVDKDRNPYTPSGGERSIIFIQRALEDREAKVFLLDEPELSMANSYIDEVIRPKITNLGKQKKTVIMATHNANLAVRTLPYMTMYRSHDSTGYKTFVGNPFTNQLININESSDTRDWKDTSMKILEGGKEAFYDREGIYESGR